MRRKNKYFFRKKSVRFLAAAALSAAMLGAQVPAVFAETGHAVVEINELIPENITVENPMKLEDVKLPERKYGTLKWKDETMELTKHVQACDVLFIPDKDGNLTDWKEWEEWDEEEEAIVSHIHVIVTGIEDDGSELECEWEEKKPEEDTEISDAEPEIEAVEDAVVEEDQSDAAQDTADPEALEKETEGEETEEKDSEKEPETDQENSEEEGKESDGTLTEEPSDNPDANHDNESDEKTDETPEENPDGTPEEELPEENQPETEEPGEEEDNIFDTPDKFPGEEGRPVDAPEGLTEEEQLYQAQLNHNCGGISVSGINLPWYVQFRATSGESYEFTNETDAMIFRSYEFELWDLKNDTEYEIPDGEYISVTVPVKEGYDYVVEHLLDNGATETIIPSVDGNTMIFSTHSFSPFGIAGSKQLVGPDFPIEEITPTPSPTPSVPGKPGDKPNGGDGTGNGTDNSGNNGTNGNGSNGNGTAGNNGANSNGNGTAGNNGTNSNGTTGSNGINSGGTTGSNGAGSNGTGIGNNGSGTDGSGISNGNGTAGNNGTGNSGINGTDGNQSYNNGKVVNTGDTTAILPFVALFAAAILVIAAVVILKKNKK